MTTLPVDLSTVERPGVRLKPEVPDAVVLPAWLDPEGLASPDALDAIRAEAARAEADFIRVTTDLLDIFRRFVVVMNAAYIATNPYYRDLAAVEVPGDVIDAVAAAVGTARLEELQGWLTGETADCPVVPDAQRDAARAKIGYLVEWDDELRTAADALARV